MAYLSPITPGLDLTYTYSPIMPQGNTGVLQVNPGTLWDYLNQETDFSIFRHIVATARMEGILNDPSASFTLFLPSDKSLLEKYAMDVFRNIDQSTAEHIVKYSSLPREVPFKNISSSSCLRLNTKIRGQDLYSKTTEEGTVLNGKAKIIRPDYIVNNAILHITDDLCKPVF